jgi:hypothetical protein
VGILEELTLPLVEQRGVDLELIAKSGNGDTLHEVPFYNGGLLLGRKMAAGLLVGHGSTSVQVMLTRTEQTSRFD